MANSTDVLLTNLQLQHILQRIVLKSVQHKKIYHRCVRKLSLYNGGISNPNSRVKIMLQDCPIKISITKGKDVAPLVRSGFLQHTPQIADVNLLEILTMSRIRSENFFPINSYTFINIPSPKLIPAIIYS